MDYGVPGGFWLDESLQVAQWLEADGSLDAVKLTAGSSLPNPMYLFTGEAPIREFAAQFPQPMRLAIQVGGSRFLRSYPYQEAYLLDRARQFRAALKLPLILLGGITRKETMDMAMAEASRSSRWPAPCCASPISSSVSSPIPGPDHSASTATKCMPTIYSGTHCVLASPGRTLAPSLPGAPRRTMFPASMRRGGGYGRDNVLHDRGRRQLY